MTELTTSDGSIITSLPFDDVVVPFILNRLSLKEVFLLRRVNRVWKHLITCYFERLQVIDLEGVSSKTALTVILDAKIGDNKELSCDTKICCCLHCKLNNRINCNEVTSSGIDNKSYEEQLQKIAVPTIFRASSPLSSDHQLFGNDSSNRRFRKLNVCECKWFSDHDLLRVQFGASNLKLLDISACFQVRNHKAYVVKQRRVFRCNLTHPINH